MSTKSGYCIYCGKMIDPVDVETISGNLIWQCPEQRCKGSKLEIKTDRSGFVLEPRLLRGSYIYSKPPERET